MSSDTSIKGFFSQLTLIIVVSVAGVYSGAEYEQARHTCPEPKQHHCPPMPSYFWQAAQDRNLGELTNIEVILRKDPRGFWWLQMDEGTDDSYLTYLAAGKDHPVVLLERND